MKSHVGGSAALIIHLSDREGDLYSLVSLIHCSRVVLWVVIHLDFQTGVSAPVSEKPWGGTGTGEMAGTMERKGSPTGSMRVPHVQTMCLA